MLLILVINHVITWELLSEATLLHSYTGQE